MGEKVEGSHAHLLVLEVRVGVGGKELVGGEKRRSGSVVIGEGASVVLGVELRAPENHRAMRKMMEWSNLAMRGRGGCSTASSSSPEQWHAAERETAANLCELDLESYL